MRGFIGLVFVEPVIGSGKANGALTNRQKSGFKLFATSNRVPTTIEVEHAAPGIEAIGDQCGVIAKQIAPLKARTLQQIDLGHDEIGDRRCRLAFAERVAAKRALSARQRHLPLAGRAYLCRRFARCLMPIEIHVLLKGSVDQR